MRFAGVVIGLEERGWRVMWFMGASLPSGWFGVVSPRMTSRLRRWAQARVPKELRTYAAAPLRIHPQADDSS